MELEEIYKQKRGNDESVISKSNLMQDISAPPKKNVDDKKIVDKPRNLKKSEFPFKPLEEESPPIDGKPHVDQKPSVEAVHPSKHQGDANSEPQISVSFEKEQAATPKTDQPTPEPKLEPKKDELMLPPPIEPSPAPVTKINDYQSIIKNSPPANKSALPYALFILLFIGLGFGGGFFGYKYYPKITSLFTTSADTNTTTQSNESNITKPQSTNSQIGDISVWPSYISSKYLYTIKYPDTWFSQNIKDVNASSIIFTSYDPQEKVNALSGYKVEVLVAPKNSQTLQDWITVNHTTSATTANPLTPFKIAGADAYQQTDSITNVKTYFALNDFVVTVTYTAKGADFSHGQVIYNQILDSIKI